MLIKRYQGMCVFTCQLKKKKIGDLNDKSENQYCLSVIFPLKRKMKIKVQNMQSKDVV